MPFFDTGPTITGTSSNDFLIGRYGGPNHLMNGGDGNDVFYGDFEQFFQGFSPTISGSANYDLSAAVSAFCWTQQENRDIANSTTVPHMTVIPTNLTGNQGWLRVTVTAGQTITLDVDYGRDTNNTDTDTVVAIYDSTGTNQIAVNDDVATAVDIGSTSNRDSNLTYTFTTAGTYLINVREFDGVFEANDEFMLHISLTGQAFQAGPAIGDDVLNGGAGDDVLYGFDGTDILNGGAGADVLDGGAGLSDYAIYDGSTTGVYARLDGVAGASGDAVGDIFIGIECLLGTSFADILVGSADSNNLLGGDGNDILYGLAGGDALYGGNGNDQLFGGDGNDDFFGGAGADAFDGGEGSDIANYSGINTGIYVRLDGGAGATGDAVGDTFISIEGILGTSGADVLVGSSVDNRLFGGNGADSLYGLAGADNLSGGVGNDNLYGGVGADRLDGGADFDLARYDDAAAGVYARLDGVAGSYGDASGDTFSFIEGFVGSAFDDILIGGNSYDYIYGSGGADALYAQGGGANLDGGSGDDNLYSGAGGDALIGGDGFDFARYDQANSSVYLRLDGIAVTTGEAAGDTFSGIEGVIGSSYFDILVGSNGTDYFYGLSANDLLYGLGGDDTLDGGLGGDSLYGGEGADTLNGGDGFDFARYDGASTAIYARLDGVAGASGEAIGDSFISIEALSGSEFNDTLIGNSSANGLYGNGGNDLIYGLDDFDILNGGAGNDRLFGGSGADWFVFSTAANVSNADIIGDFEVGVDDIILSQSIFAGIGTTLDANEFQLGAADAATDRILYFSATGQLFYDADGNGGGAAQLIATITAGTVLTLADFGTTA